MSKAKIDVLLPYWGEFELLKKAVESVLAQTETDWRLQIFDDCYPSLEASEYCAKLHDNRIVYYRHKKNIGVTKNFNFALQKATANYCVLLGCDDKMLPSYIETALANIGDADFYQPSIEVIDEHDNVYLPLGDRIKKLLQPTRSGQLGGEKLATSLSNGNWLYFPSILWKTTTIKKYSFDPSYTITQDVMLELNVIKDGGILFFDKNITFQYRRFAKSLSSTGISSGTRFREETKVYTYFADKFKAIGWKKAARASTIHITSRLHQLITKL